jgi:serine/threonine-protein kinase ULK/ATG1
LCETPPPTNFWTPVAKTAPANYSPLRRSGRSECFVRGRRLTKKCFEGTSPPRMSGPLARMPILSSPNLNNENNNPNRSPNMPYCTRAVTLPEISEIRNYAFFNDSYEQHPITFLAPELPEETLLEVCYGICCWSDVAATVCTVSDMSYRYLATTWILCFKK